jgi:hypothetical protein
MAFVLPGAVLLTAIHQQDPAGVTLNGSLGNNLPAPAPPLANSGMPTALLPNNPPLALQITNQADNHTVPELPVTPGVYVTHPYVIAVLMPGGVDPGMVRGSLHNLEMDEMAMKPELHLDPVK